MLALFSDHTFRHYAYLRDSLSHLVPPLRVRTSAAVYMILSCRAALTLSPVIDVCLSCRVGSRSTVWTQWTLVLVLVLWNRLISSFNRV